ncbi:MAG: hypothetical protein KC713_03095 [Candidatus Omnitrophica bacterium]|nr:hypothetical protein [Candidatus Omnitrophota bacterium]
MINLLRAALIAMIIGSVGYSIYLFKDVEPKVPDYPQVVSKVEKNEVTKPQKPSLNLFTYLKGKFTKSDDRLHVYVEKQYQEYVRLKVPGCNMDTFTFEGSQPFSENNVRKVKFLARSDLTCPHQEPASRQQNIVGVAVKTGQFYALPIFNIETE